VGQAGLQWLGLQLGCVGRERSGPTGLARGRFENLAHGRLEDGKYLFIFYIFSQFTNQFEFKSSLIFELFQSQNKIKTLINTKEKVCIGMKCIKQLQKSKLI
jgi:hypothetical protein